MALLKMVTPPAILPVTLDEMKLHLRVQHDEENALIQSIIAAATADCEKETARQLVEATLELVLVKFPVDLITLPRPPVREVLSITYKDSGGADATVPAGQYELDGNENTAFVVAHTAWPTGTQVRVKYLGGWPVKDGEDAEGNVTQRATTPDALKQWTMNRGTGMYEQRSSLASATRKIAIPMSRDFMGGLLDRYRLYGPEIEI